MEQVIEEANNNAQQMEVVTEEEVTTEEAIEVANNTTQQAQIAKDYHIYSHPLIQVLQRTHTQEDVIDTLQAFVGNTEAGVNPDGSIVYDVVDQMDYFPQVMEVFAYACGYGHEKIVQWLLDNYVPLDVSYNENQCFIECIRMGHIHIAKMIMEHESFNPSVDVLIAVKNNDEYLRTYLMKPNLDGDLKTYRYTLLNYLENKQYTEIESLLNNIKYEIKIDDVILDEPIEVNI